MKAGAGKSEIILTDEYLEIENFTVIHRALNARAVAMEDDEGKTFVCLSLEVTSPGADISVPGALFQRLCYIF